MPNEWYRTAEWDTAAQTDFESRLERSRPHHRQQYLRIKGLSLRAAGNLDAARELLERAASAPDGHIHESVSAWEALADMAKARGDGVEAERLYRRILDDHPSLSGSTGSVEISLAELLIDRAGARETAEALELLRSWIEREGMKFDNELFRWHLCLIKVAERNGDRETAQRAARTALGLAERGPQLTRRPDVELVEADRKTLKHLRELAT